MNLKGIDVSKNQPDVDWEKVKRAGYAWAIIRAGYQGYTKGGIKTDPLFKKHIEGATAAGLAVGVYWICQSVTPEEAVKAADYCCKLIKPYKVPLGVWWDNEPTAVYPRGRGDNVSKEMRTEIGKAFLERIRQHGYLAGIYTNLDYLTYKLDWPEFERYPLWLAQWNAKQPARDCAIWQYDASDVPGVAGKCDRNIMFDSELVARALGSASAPPPVASLRTEPPFDVVVTASNLNVRSGAGTNHPVRHLLPRGSRVTILRELNGWGRILIKPNLHGWISLKYTRQV